MYEKQFQFRTRPFCSIPSADHYFPASSVDSALETVKLCVDRAAGPALIFGQSGWGKSQLLAMLQREFKPQFRVANIIACTRMSRRHDLLQNILFELGQPYREMSEGELRLALIDYLKPSAQCPNGVLLLVDDGQTLSIRLLDELRMITNFVREGQPRVRLVIAGTHELEEKLAHPQLESLNHRVAARCYLQGFRRDEVDAYVRHQLTRAGAADPNLFQPSAIAALADLCDGNPRTINQVSDHALILAASCGQRTVDGELIAEALSDIQRFPVHSWTPSSGSESAAGPDSKLNASGVVEFGAIQEHSSIRDTDSTIHNPPDPVLDPVTTVDESMGEFSKMVDSLAHLYAISLDDETHEPDAESAVPPEPSDSSRDRAADPFAEMFAEECPVADTYADLASQHNRRAVQISGDDVTQLEQQLKRLPIVEYSSYRGGRQEPGEPGPIPKQPAADDRDMLLISPDSSDRDSKRAGTPDIGGVSVSRGQAVRLEYGALFQQLRGSASSLKSI